MDEAPDKELVPSMELGQMPAYDIAELKRLVGEGTTGLYAIITSFIEKTPPEVNALSEAIDSQDWPRMGAQAHKLKSNLKLFGLQHLADDLQLLEEMGKGSREKLPLPEIKGLAGKIALVFARAIDKLPAELPSDRT